MRWLKIVLPIAIIGGAILVAMQIIAARPEVERIAAPPPTLLVQVAVAEREPVTFTVHSQGVVTPRTRTTLVSEVSGQIAEVAPAFVSGGFFKAGDVLVRIDPRHYQTAFKRARSEVAKARTKVATEHALAGYAYQDWQRLRELNAAASRPASDLALRKPQLAEAVAALEFAEADLEKATEDLDRTVIRAPYDGMVREKRADVGQYVNVGTQVAETFATDYAEVRLPLPQVDLQYLDLPDADSETFLPVELSADIGGVRRAWQGRIVRSEGVFDAESRVLHVVAQVDDPYGQTGNGDEPLRIGTFVTAEIEGRDGGDMFVIPRHSLQRGETLWLVGEDMAIHPRHLEIVRADERFSYVASGLADGERYTVTPPEQPLPGMLVRVNE
ncbi:MAG: efflux RND transporter periplasmic adaptor subunit [Gammaproteobacteria bacterium]|nr:efflux RND transporter periplasmic adaptor subunit [Gammaproteobacteria bacterium]